MGDDLFGKLVHLFVLLVVFVRVVGGRGGKSCNGRNRIYTGISLMHGEALLSVAELIIMLHSSYRSGGRGGAARAGAGAAALETVRSHCTVQEEVLVVEGINAVLVSFSHRHLIDSVLVDA